MHVLPGRATAAALAMLVFSAAAAQDPCYQILDACTQAGFVGGGREGLRLGIDCAQPIMQGRRVSNRGRALPQVDPEVIAACKKANPEFEARPAATQVRREQTTAIPPSPVASLPAPSSSPPGRRPNIVFVLTDDLSWNLVQYMPHALAMQKQGVTFVNYFVTDSLCCPSRASIFTGRYPHNTGIFRNVGADGGFLLFHARGHEQATFATALSSAGYRTAMLGKYLNGYQPRTDPPAAGWTLWAVAGDGYQGFNYDLNENGKVVHYGNDAKDYMTDVLSRLAVRFIAESAGKPFVIEVATFAPHAPYTPAPRDSNALPGLKSPRPPAFNAAPDAGAPQWLKALPLLSSDDIAAIDRDFRKRAQSVLAVDALIGELQAAVVASGEGKNTYFVFSSDNGYHMGEHRLMPGKQTAFDSDIRVPLMVTGPGIPAGLVVHDIAENVDLCPTFTELAGMLPSTNIDGRSLVPLLRGEKIAGWRGMALVEHHGPVKDLLDPDLPSPRSGNPTTYEAIRSPDSLYVEYANGEKEYHDFATDPNELRNTFSLLSSDARQALHAAVTAAAACRGVRSCSEAASAERMPRRP